MANDRQRPPEVVVQAALNWYRDQQFDPGDDCVGELVRPGDEFDTVGNGRAHWYLYFHPPSYVRFSRPYALVIIDAETLEVVRR